MKVQHALLALVFAAAMSVALLVVHASASPDASPGAGAVSKSFEVLTVVTRLVRDWEDGQQGL